MMVGESIRKLREDNDLTQEQLGEIAGVSSMAVSQWENGRAVPRMGAIQRMADYFGIPKSTIMGDEPRIEYAVVSLDELENEERELLALFRRMDAGMKATVLSTARNFAALSETGGLANDVHVERAGTVEVAVKEA